MKQILNSYFQISGNRSSVSDEALEVWFELFGPVRREFFTKAMKSHCVRNRFQPTPSEIYIELDAIRIDIFSKIHWQRTIKHILSGEIELDEGETLEEYQEMAWKDDRIFEYENELETLNKVLSVKYGEEG